MAVMTYQYGTLTKKGKKHIVIVKYTNIKCIYLKFTQLS